jgi:hypothetical protein
MGLVYHADHIHDEDVIVLDAGVPSTALQDEVSQYLTYFILSSNGHGGDEVLPADVAVNS